MSHVIARSQRVRPEVAAPDDRLRVEAIPPLALHWIASLSLAMTNGIETAGSVSATGRNSSKMLSRVYFRPLRLAANESFAIKAALHQLEPRPLGFCVVTLPRENDEFDPLVKTLHSALVRLVS